MSISYLTQVLLINTLCIIFIYFFKGKFPLFYGGSFEGVGLEIKLQTNNSSTILITEYESDLESGFNKCNVYFQWVSIDILNIKKSDSTSDLYSLIGIVDIFEDASSYFNTTSFKSSTRK